jgi:hypothetical protein
LKAGTIPATTIFYPKPLLRQEFSCGRNLALSPTSLKFHCKALARPQNGANVATKFHALQVRQGPVKN